MDVCILHTFGKLKLSENYEVGGYYVGDHRY